MPRKPRFFIPGIPLQVVQRGHNRAQVFFEDEEYETYLAFLAEATERYGCAVHAYVLMPHHIHLLVTARKEGAVSRMMQHVGLKFVPYINRVRETSGTLWEGRYRSSLVDDAYLLSCMQYIELDPVRSKVVRTPTQYKWSSYRANAQGRSDPLVTPHVIYEGLGRSAPARRTAYRARLRDRLTPAQLDEITAAWQTGTPLGARSFLDKVERKLKQKVGYAKRGRPPKRTEVQ